MDLDLTNESGYINIEKRKDGGIGIYIESIGGTLQIDKDEMITVINWLKTYLQSQDETGATNVTRTDKRTSRT